MESNATTSFEAHDDLSRQSSLRPSETEDDVVDSDDEQFLCGYGRLNFSSKI